MILARRSGFSLIEILVVVAVVAVLAGLLMPALAVVKDGARRATCSLRLGTLAGACRLYTTDWNGMLPSTRVYIAKPWGKGAYKWCDILAPYVDSGTGSGDGSAGYNVRTANSVVQGCPSGPGWIDGRGFGINDQPLQPGNSRSAYGDLTLATPVLNDIAWRLVSEQDRRALFEDSADYMVVLDSSKSTWLGRTGNADRHHGRINTAFFDGGVRLLTMTQAATAVTDPKTLAW